MLLQHWQSADHWVSLRPMCFDFGGGDHDACRAKYHQSWRTPVGPVMIDHYTFEAQEIAHPVPVRTQWSAPKRPSPVAQTGRLLPRLLFFPQWKQELSANLSAFVDGLAGVDEACQMAGENPLFCKVCDCSISMTKDRISTADCIAFHLLTKWHWLYLLSLCLTRYGGDHDVCWGALLFQRWATSHGFLYYHHYAGTSLMHTAQEAAILMEMDDEIFIPTMDVRIITPSVRAEEPAVQLQPTTAVTPLDELSQENWGKDRGVPDHHQKVSRQRFRV